MSRVTRGTPSGDAYLDLQNHARRTRRQTQELLQLYVLEGFLARLAASAMRETLARSGTRSTKPRATETRAFCHWRK